MLVRVGQPISNVEVERSQKDRFVLARQMCLWFCRDLVAFNIANKAGFHDFAVFAKMIKENEKLPDRTTLANTALNDIYSAVKGYITKFVKTSLPRTITTSFDFWSDNVKRISYINYWVHWINNDFEIQKLCLGIKRFPHPHEGQLIADPFNCIVNEFGLSDKNFVGVTDSGSNIKLACRLLNLEREPCLCHNLHLLVAYDLIKKHPSMKPIRDLIIRMKVAKKALIYKYEDLQKIHDQEYNKRLLHLISSLQNICESCE